MGIVKAVGQAARVLRVVGVASVLVAVAVDSSAQSILPGNFLPNPDFETETRFVAHQTEGPTDNSFADYWHHDVFSGWNDLTPPVGWPPAPFDLGGTVTTEPVLSGIHSMRLFDQESYYFAPEIVPGAGSFAAEDIRTFSTAIPVDLSSPTGFAEKLWVRWHWNYDMSAGFDNRVTFNFRTSNAPVVSLDLAGLVTDHAFKTAEDPNTFLSSSNGLWEQETMFIDLTGAFDPQKSFDIVIETQGTSDAIGLVWVDDVSVSTIDPNAIADYNNNGIVDAADYTKWLDTLGSTVDLAADGNNNNVIDQGDYDLWKAQFGLAAGSGSATSAAIPEPTSWVLWFVGIGFIRAMQRRRRL